MRILLVSATQLELNPVLEHLKSFQNAHKLTTLVTGVGMTATAFALGQKLTAGNYDLAINIGLAGAFDRSLELGEVINVTKDQLSEEGAEDGNHFLTLNELGLRKPINVGVYNGKFSSSFKLTDSNLKELSGITVNTVHGNEGSIQKIIDRLNPQVESMEGAAFMYACHSVGLPCLQIRAISNYVEKRNREAWKIELALNNLANSIAFIIQQF